jgi:guanylate kinase
LGAERVRWEFAELSWRRRGEKRAARQYIIINDDLQRAYSQASAVVSAERAKGPRVAAGVEGFVEGLLKG